MNETAQVNARIITDFTFESVIKLIPKAGNTEGFWRYSEGPNGELEVRWEKKLVSKS